MLWLSATVARRPGFLVFYVRQRGLLRLISGERGGVERGEENDPVPFGPGLPNVCLPAHELVQRVTVKSGYTHPCHFYQESGLKVVYFQSFHRTHFTLED